VYSYENIPIADSDIKALNFLNQNYLFTA